MVHSGQLLRSTIKTQKSKHDTARAMIPASFTSNLTNREALVWAPAGLQTNPLSLAVQPSKLRKNFRTKSGA